MAEKKSPYEEKKPPYEVIYDGKKLVLKVYGNALIREDEEKKAVATIMEPPDPPWEIEVLWNTGKAMRTGTRSVRKTRKKR